MWSAEIRDLEKLYNSIKGELPDLEKELEQLIHFDDPNVIMLYSRRCLEVIITDLCECELNRERGTTKDTRCKTQGSGEILSFLISQNKRHLFQVSF